MGGVLAEMMLPIMINSATHGMIELAVGTQQLPSRGCCGSRTDPRPMNRTAHCLGCCSCDAARPPRRLARPTTVATTHIHATPHH